MKLNKASVSARVKSPLKLIVMESSFTHGDAYELGAKLIATGDANKTIDDIDENPDLLERIKKIEYKIINEQKTELEKELDRLGGA